MTTDKTGAPTTVTAGDGRYTIAVDDEDVGLTAFADHGNQRIFYHTEVDHNYEGRGLASILVGEALNATKADGLRIVAVCPMVAGYVKKHQEFDDVDSVTADIKRWLQTLTTG
jgi:predicted GNAT family acetyltransferase